MKPNTATNDLYASRMIRDLDAQANPRPDLGLAILGLYGLLLGLFLYWVTL